MGRCGNGILHVRHEFYQNSMTNISGKIFRTLQRPFLLQHISYILSESNGVGSAWVKSKENEELRRLLFLLRGNEDSKFPAMRHV